MAQPTAVARPAVAPRAWRPAAVRRGARRLAGLSNRARPRPRCAASAEPVTGGADDGETFIIVGASGRVGTALVAVCASAGIPHIPVRRDTDDGVFEGTAGPIFVATHASDLDAVVRRVPRERHRDLVFLQGGLLRDGWLERRGLRRATQAALYLAAGTGTDQGAMRDGGGASVAHGPRAADVVRLLALGGVACAAVDEKTFAKKALEKLLWASAFWVLCAAGSVETKKKPLTVGEIVDGVNGVATKKRAERLLGELFDVAASRRDFAFLRENDATQNGARETAVENALAYSRSIPSAVPDREMARKEASFRNGWFLMGQETIKKRNRFFNAPGERASLHADLLLLVGVDPAELAADAAQTHL